MKCVLTGHKPIEVEGIGRYAGRKATVCEHCGKGLSESTVPARRLSGYESVAEEQTRAR